MEAQEVEDGALGEAVALSERARQRLKADAVASAEVLAQVRQIGLVREGGEEPVGRCLTFRERLGEPDLSAEIGRLVRELLQDLRLQEEVVLYADVVTG